jgi:hypothetical protein
LFSLDPATLAEQHADGEVWSVLERDVPSGYVVVAIERGATTRVVLRQLDATGRELRRIVVYEGADITAAHVGHSGGAYIVHVS